MGLDKLLKEINEAEIRGEETLEYELYDIMENAPIYGKKLEELLEENIKYILEREGFYDPKEMGSVIIPAGGLDWECDQGICTYRADFSVYDPSGWHVLIQGTALGTMIPIDEETMQIEDMVVYIPVKWVKKLLEAYKIKA